MQVTYTPSISHFVRASSQIKYSKINKISKTNEEPERYYDWMLWKLRQKDSEDIGGTYDKKHI